MSRTAKPIDGWLLLKDGSEERSCFRPWCQSGGQHGQPNTRGSAVTSRGKRGTRTGLLHQEPALATHLSTQNTSGFYEEELQNGKNMETMAMFKIHTSQSATIKACKVSHQINYPCNSTKFCSTCLHITHKIKEKSFVYSWKISLKPSFFTYNLKLKM